MDSTQTPYDESILIPFTVPGAGRVFIPYDHQPRIVVGIAAVSIDQLEGDPYDPNTQPLFDFQMLGFLTLIEAGTMQPRVKRLPMQRMNQTFIGTNTLAAGGPDVGGGPQPFRLRMGGPVIDIGASWVDNSDASPWPVFLEFFIRYA